RHGSQTIDALKHGCNVLLDKPLASSLQEAHRIIEARDASKGWVMTGYQWSFSKAIRDLKQDLLDGKLGKVKRAKTMILWPRDYNYYNRNNWAGKKYSHSGEIINDNPVNNAMAHFLHNLLYLTGSSMEESAVPVSGQAELYRAYNIQTFDTAVLELFTRDETRISFYGSHATHTEKGPLFILECDNGVVYYGELSKDIVAVFNDGSIKNYGNPDDTLQFHKLKVAIEACQNKPTLICPPEASLAHTQVIEALSEIKLIKGFEPSLVVDDGVRRYVQGLSYMIYSSYQQGVMPGQSGFAYASPGQKFNIKY
ncbi:MAG: Gfo/Idh/MocA family oxidoreductase, partial [Bacteroidetes bacterium]|nr:Gfo/Idh/MocA family oxidoreductase [Bacteroidota bacterium]